MSATQAMPWHVGTAARLHIADGPHRFLVMIAADPADAVPEALTRPGGLSAVVTHDRGRTWPDRRGESLARAMLEAGGVACLAFPTLADALACQARLRGPQ